MAAVLFLSTCSKGQVLAILELRQKFAHPPALAFVNVSLG
jgi:hypothetical protein